MSGSAESYQLPLQPHRAPPVDTSSQVPSRALTLCCAHTTYVLLLCPCFCPPPPPLQLADPSLLRFLVDMRGADPDDKQLRDDLMTMLIAGETQLCGFLRHMTHCCWDYPFGSSAARAIVFLRTLVDVVVLLLQDMKPLLQC